VLSLQGGAPEPIEVKNSSVGLLWGVRVAPVLGRIYKGLAPDLGETFVGWFREMQKWGAFGSFSSALTFQFGYAEQIDLVCESSGLLLQIQVLETNRIAFLFHKPLLVAFFF
jgi:hypothetical protein